MNRRAPMITDIAFPSPPGGAMNHYVGRAPTGAFHLAPGDAVSRVPTVDDTAPSDDATVLDGLVPANHSAAD